jgi:hypothetical protein
MQPPPFALEFLLRGDSASCRVNEFPKWLACYGENNCWLIEDDEAFAEQNYFRRPRSDYGQNLHRCYLMNTTEA